MLNKYVKLLIFDELLLLLSVVEMCILFDIVCDLKCCGVVCVYILYKFDEVVVVCDMVFVICDGCYVVIELMVVLIIDWIIVMMVGCEICDLYLCELYEIGDVVFDVCYVMCCDVMNVCCKWVDDVLFSVWCGEIVGVVGLVGVGCIELM